jgi:hypothetical protein
MTSLENPLSKREEKKFNSFKHLQRRNTQSLRKSAKGNTEKSTEPRTEKQANKRRLKCLQIPATGTLFS